MPDVNWAIWRVVYSGKATLQEIETHWSLDDLLDFNEILDYQDYIQAKKNRELEDRRK